MRVTSFAVYFVIFAYATSTSLPSIKERDGDSVCQGTTGNLNANCYIDVGTVAHCDALDKPIADYRNGQ